MARIRVLPPEVVNRIAAGEVVERPASVLKELVENAIDASATEISIDLEEGGTKLIYIRDNGSGIPPDEMPLAFESHATSKLTEEDLRGNLLGVSTLGFRGEALASIASIAMVEMVSRTHGAAHAYRFRPGSSNGAALEPAAGDLGTSIEVRNLFYNTPARRKFLRSPATELSHAIQHLTRIALGFPGMTFRLTQARKSVLELPAVDDLRGRLRQILGDAAADGLLPVRHAPGSAELASLHGFVGDPRNHRKDAGFGTACSRTRCAPPIRAS
jgi:DNA mismatch repair protein MutL